VRNLLIDKYMVIKAASPNNKAIIMFVSRLIFKSSRRLAERTIKKQTTARITALFTAMPKGVEGFNFTMQ